MSGHTPGPWSYIGDEDGDFMILAGEESFVANIGSPIQAVSLNPKVELVAFDVDQANARLITAAPALLEALEAARVVVEAEGARATLAIIDAALTAAKQDKGGE